MHIDLDAPLKVITAGLQLSIDIVGHLLRAVDAYGVDRDRALPSGVVATFGVHTESQVPGLPIATQLGPSLAPEIRPLAARTWVLRKGMGDTITALSLFAVQERAANSLVELLRGAQPTRDALVAAASTDSPDARQFDGMNLPAKMRWLRELAQLENDAELLDLEDRVLSINRVRNCLEHRGGFVGDRDCDDGTDRLSMRWVAVDMTADGKTETVSPDEYVEQLHVNFRTKREREFPRGTGVILSAREFSELCWTVGEYVKAIANGYAARLRSDPALANALAGTATVRVDNPT